MKISTPCRNLVFDFSRITKNKTALLTLTIITFFQVSDLKSQNCKLCSIPSFPSVTIYQSFQTGHGMGFGAEAGTWNKDAGKFSYFVGTSLVWVENKQTDAKTISSQKQALLSFYLKGQYQLSTHLYVIAAPGIVNLSYFDLQTGFRYVFPLTNVIGIGLEPAYSFNQRQFVINTNIHFALK
ncbi:MAG TPA: hypothetical protein VGO21_00580 [Candidatus Paceibacterota bacterium]|nr:hypothetical protein [Candidatus Paceibacterota bacterium]